MPRLAGQRAGKGHFQQREQYVRSVEVCRMCRVPGNGRTTIWLGQKVQENPARGWAVWAWGAGTLSWGPWGVMGAVGKGGSESALGVGRPLWQYLKDWLV